MHLWNDLPCIVCLQVGMPPLIRIDGSATAAAAAGAGATAAGAAGAGTAGAGAAGAVAAGAVAAGAAGAGAAPCVGLPCNQVWQGAYSRVNALEFTRDRRLMR